MGAVGIIPARLASSRLPRKLLLNQTGRPLLQYAWEAACRARTLDAVVIATDSAEIAEVAAGFGATVEMTGEHPSGTDRIGEVVRRRCHPSDVIVNVQADEPDLAPEHIDRLVSAMQGDPALGMATLGTPITTLEVLLNPARVKVVCAMNGRALYFSRLPIPACRDEDPAERLRRIASQEAPAGDAPLRRWDSSPWLLHIGMYAYRARVLTELTQLPPSPLERLECLEQLRALEHGIPIQVEVVSHSASGIDTPEDYQRFVARRAAA